MFAGKEDTEEAKTGEKCDKKGKKEKRRQKHQFVIQIRYGKLK